MQAALGAFQDSMWERKFADLAAGAAGAGCSPGGALAAIRAIPAQSARGRLLRRHALAALLKRTIPGKVGYRLWSLTAPMQRHQGVWNSPTDRALEVAPRACVVTLR